MRSTNRRLKSLTGLQKQGKMSVPKLTEKIKMEKLPIIPQASRAKFTREVDDALDELVLARLEPGTVIYSLEGEEAEKFYREHFYGDDGRNYSLLARLLPCSYDYQLEGWDEEITDERVHPWCASFATLEAGGAALMDWAVYGIKPEFHHYRVSDVHYKEMRAALIRGMKDNARAGESK